MPQQVAQAEPERAASEEDDAHELDEVERDLAVAIADRLQRRDLPTLERERAREDDVDEERGDREEDGGCDDRVRRELQELAFEHVVRDLAIAAAGRYDAVGREQPLQVGDHVRLGGAGLEREDDVVEAPLHAKRGRDGRAVHPEDPEARRVVDERAARA